MGFKVSLLFALVIVGIWTYEIAAERPELCQLPLKTGECRIHIPRYGYNPASGQCEEFVYGGCNANANNFETMAECETTCKNA